MLDFFSAQRILAEVRLGSYYPSYELNGEQRRVVNEYQEASRYKDLALFLSKSDPNFFRWFFQDSKLKDFECPDKDIFEKFICYCDKVTKDELKDLEPLSKEDVLKDLRVVKTAPLKFFGETTVKNKEVISKVLNSAAELLSVKKAILLKGKRIQTLAIKDDIGALFVNDFVVGDLVVSKENENYVILLSDQNERTSFCCNVDDAYNNPDFLLRGGDGVYVLFCVVD